MKFFFFFFFFCISLSANTSVKGWTPSGPIEYTKEAVRENLIWDIEKKCLIKYFGGYNPALFIKLTKDECLDTGYHEVQILNNNLPHAELKGYFLGGYFLGNTPLNAVLLKRSAEPDGHQNLFYYIDSSKDLEAVFLGKMVQNNDFDMNVCDAFDLIIVSDNKLLFTDELVRGNLFLLAQNYAAKICPNTKKMIVRFSDNPETYHQEYLQTYYFKKEYNRWVTDKPLPLFSQTKIENPIHLILTANIFNQKAAGRLIAHIYQKGDTFWTDYPFVMEVKSKTDLGWFMIDGEIEAMNNFDKKRSGIPIDEWAGYLYIQSSQKCGEVKCTDIQ